MTNSGDGLPEGALYKSDNLPVAFYKLINTLKEIVDGVRSVGNNAQNAARWKSKLDDVLSEIEDSGIIASK